MSRNTPQDPAKRTLLKSAAAIAAGTALAASGQRQKRRLRRLHRTFRPKLFLLRQKPSRHRYPAPAVRHNIRL